MGMPKRHDVLIIGAGLAGLRAAERLHSSGFQVLLLEAEGRVGGRVATDHVDGFLLDHGFQLYNPAYPAGQATFDQEALELGQFDRGVTVASAENEITVQLSLAGLAKSVVGIAGGQLGGPIGLAALLRYLTLCGATSMAQLSRRPDVTIAEAFRQAGLDPKSVRELLAPFLSGVFADIHLDTSRRYADLILRSFVRGVPGVPAAGMAALPEQIVSQLPADCVRTGTPVRNVLPGKVETDHETLHATAVVVATAAPVAQQLLPGLETAAMRSLTTWYFSAPEALSDRRVLTVGTGLQGLANIAVMNAASSSYAPAGTSLVAATAVGDFPDYQSAKQARRATAAGLQLARNELDLIACYPIKHALPAATVPFSIRKPIDLGDGLFVVGDHRDTPSIQGALVSGRRGADSVAHWLRTRS